MDYRGFLSIICLLYFVYSQRKRIGVQPLAHFFIPAYLLKLIAGIGMGALYTFYYGYGDILVYNSDANFLASLLFEAPSSFMSIMINTQTDVEITRSLSTFELPRALFMVKITALLKIFIGHNFWIASIFLSSFSFFGLWYLANQFYKFIPSSKWAAAIAFLFFPSVVFWSSGLLKESVAMGTMGLGLAVLVPQLIAGKRTSPFSWLLAIVMFWLLFKLKYFYALLFVPIIITCLLIPLFKFKKAWKRIIVWYVLFLILTGAASLLHPNLSAERFTMIIVDNYYTMVDNSSAGKHLIFDGLEESIWSIAVFFPKAIVSGLYSPLFPNRNFLTVLASIESVFLIFLTAFSFRNISEIWNSKYNYLIMAILVYTVVEAGLLALSMPVFGTLVRYKIGFLPFLLFLIMIKNPLLKLLPNP